MELSFFQQALKKSGVSSGVHVEVFVSHVEGRSIGWADGKPLLQNYSSTKRICARVLDQGKHGLFTTTASDSTGVANAIHSANDIAIIAPNDQYHRFGSPAAARSAAIPIDESLFKRPTTDWFEHLRELEKRIMNFDKRIKKVVRLVIDEERETTWIRNTNSLSVEKATTSARVVGEVLAEEKGQSEVSWDILEQRFVAGLDFDGLADRLAFDAVQSLGGSVLPSGSYPICLHPRVATQLLSLFGGALSAEAVHLGRSFLKGLCGKPVAAPIIQMTDDPFLLKGAASQIYDDEGTPHEKMNVVTDGILKSYFYDLKSAGKDNRASNGHGIKDGVGALPSPHATNLSIEAGRAQPADLLAAEKRIFLIKDVMGLHMADPITGEFSLGASGSLYENGKYSHAVRGVTIAGSIPELLRRIVHVGNDLMWYGQYGSPSLFLSELTVAGK